MAFIHRLSCGLCGFVSPHFNNTDNDTWAPYFRALYVVGPLPPEDGGPATASSPSPSPSDPEQQQQQPPPQRPPHQQPRLSGVGFFRHNRPDNYVPVDTHRRCVEEPGGGGAAANGPGDGADGNGWYFHTLHGFFQLHGAGGGGGGGGGNASGGHGTSHDGAAADDPDLAQRTPPRMVRIRGIAPPGGEVPAEEQDTYAWGFLFHEACWAVLEQAARPGTVDLAALWRVLNSVPCGSKVPNWGHNYGGLYVGSVGGLGDWRGHHGMAGGGGASRRPARHHHRESRGSGSGLGERRFVLLARYSNLVIPSTFHNPFRVPELRRIVAEATIKDRSGDDEEEEKPERQEDGVGSKEKQAGEGGGEKMKDVNKEISSNSTTLTISPPPHILESVENTAHKDMEARASTVDPFAVLPLELKELLLCYAPSSAVANLRLASRAMAASPLSQQFFRSRFWPGREMHVFFDAFLPQPPPPQPPPPSQDHQNEPFPRSSPRPVTDWARLYWTLKLRRRYNRVGLGERNRLRLWDYTVSPLIEAVDQVARMSELRGQVASICIADELELESAMPTAAVVGPDDDSDDDDGENGGSGNASGSHTPAWRIRSTAMFAAPLAFGAARRIQPRAEVEFPTGPETMKGVYVSFVRFFGADYVTGLRFVFGGDDDEDSSSSSGSSSDLAIGYILRGSETYLPVYGSLDGFHTAADECGFRAIALITGQHMVTEYLEWAGDVGSLAVTPMKSTGNGLRKLRAAFDGFRLQALLVPTR